MSPPATDGFPQRFGKRLGWYYFALTLLLSLALAAAPFFTDAEYKSVAIMAVAWLIVLLGALLLFGRIALWLLVGSPIIGLALLVTYAFGPRHPPSIIASAFTATNQYEPDREKIASIFATTFPIGSQESKLVRTLQEQGFEFPPRPLKDCLPPGHALPKVVPQSGVEICPTEDERRTMSVGWGPDVACSWVLWVRWAADGHGKITSMKTGDYYVCL